MRKILSGIIVCLIAINANAQVTGDTIVVNSLNYASIARDTLVNFPNNGLTYEKILMRYNMRCKNALVSSSSQPNLGCGEWDYSCNTYIVDSTKVEEALNTHPDYIISNFSGTTFNYTTQPLFDYYDFGQTNVVLSNIISENQYTIGSGSTSINNLLKTNEYSGKSHILYSASELTTAGFSAGNIDGILLSVANAGGNANFFKVKLKHTALAALSSASVQLTAWSEVFNSNYNFVTGNNRLQFYAPFVWDGVSNVLIELSFTNTVAGNPIVFNGTTESSIVSLYTTNNYALDLSALGNVTLNTSMMTSVSNQLSVSFWAYGDSSVMPTETSIIYGYANDPTQRHLNIHLPWSDNTIYFDCGYAAGNFDRINKVATAADQGGKWNHWVFTKNATTGYMKIYLNGALWLSTAAKTKPISLLNLILGADNNNLNNYKGKINELSIWDKELTAAEVTAWRNKPLDASHPSYANLLAYYKMDEGAGLTITDYKNSLTSTGNNLQWTQDRGNKLEKTFAETNLRPNITFLRGTYNQTATQVLVRDSVARNPNVVQNYSITFNGGTFPIANDIVNLVSTVSLYEALAQNIYDGDNDTLTGTIPVATQGSISIVDLTYYKRYPYYNEIMSFVTPYGKNLDLGVAGKTWYYDVTDFAPLLIGPKRMLMTLGGQNQEQMDIQFLFIVGTPPRNVLAFDQLWQGSNRSGSASIGSINTGIRYELLNVPLLSTGQSFKVRSTITGHGSEGEFGQNGGIVSHYFNLNGGSNEFTWQITQECSTNPVYPQGGTWVYDRQGWCPGQSSLLKEFNITPFVTPGTTATLDYNCSNPANPNGDYRYIAAHQLVTYGAANHSLDARIIEVKKPTDLVLHSRTNPMCDRPIIVVQNAGSTPVTALTIEYWLNNSAVKQSYSWTGNLNFMDTASVVLPIGALWQNGLQPSANKFNAEIINANSVTDQYSFNNKYTSSFEIPYVLPDAFTIEFKSNNRPAENTYQIFDDAGAMVAVRTFATANTVYTDNYVLNGCFTLRLNDSGGDGIQWWANTAQGTGYLRIKNMAGVLLKTLQPDFGSRIELSFTTDPTLAVNENDLASSIKLYPNPSYGKFMLEGKGLENADIKVADVVGKAVKIINANQNTLLEINTTQFKPGVYTVTITKNNNTATKKLVVY